MSRPIYVFIFCFALLARAAENPNDSYDFQTRCPKEGAIAEASFATNPYYQDGRTFPICQCTSYVSFKLNQLWGNTRPKFTNQYYGRARWGNAHEWYRAAQESEIGITGARDNFTWDVPSYNAIFPGDVAYWKQGPGFPYGHVAYVEAVGRDVYKKGVAWVEISEYNYLYPPGYEYTRHTLFKDDPRFPDYFLHIDQDRVYCLANPTIGSCPSLLAGKRVASGSGEKVGGLGGGLDAFNLKINNFWVKDLALGYTLVPEGHTVMTGQALEVRTQIKAWNGDASHHMRDGRDRIEIDVYVREDRGDWRFLQREYTRASNLPNGATHTEHVAYTVPPGVSEVSFKAKIDAEDEASEAHEGDNWSAVLIFSVNNTPTIDFTVPAIGINTTQPILAGSLMGAKMAIHNIGNSAPPVGIRSSYAVRGPGTNNQWVQIADDGSDPGDLIPGRYHWEEILALVAAPTVPGTYDLRGCADYLSGVMETDEGNNCLINSFTVHPRPAPQLVITKFQDESGCCTTNTGSRIKPNIWVRNDGPASPGTNVTIIYHISSPVATGGAYIHIGYGSIEPRELPPGGTDEDYMDGSWSIPKSGAWRNQWHTIRGCLKADGSTPVGDPNTEVCAHYTRYSKK